MNKYVTNYSQRSEAMTVIVIILVLALLTALGWIFWQNLIHKETPQKDTELVVVDKTKKEATTPVKNRYKKSPIMARE